MAASKLVILSIFLALIFSQIRAVASIPAEEEEPVKFPRSDTPDSSALKIELNQLRAKILEFDASEKIKALKKKNELIEEEEEVIQGNSDSISSLQSEIESLQRCQLPLPLSRPIQNVRMLMSLDSYFLCVPGFSHLAMSLTQLHRTKDEGLFVVCNLLFNLDSLFLP
ncbi:uncharacterized protein LOC126592752 isoform X1 [Malus sylvestris]|uniref:uncharacterized protein LOC126592752 isoform X1 n=1 Tax=Malus sylvestris TaxID=3752 RepID=UPI0021ABEE58|nr:uncharacterized protein LOC126592752 isoform X1 [Malus sylvestris]